jgi:hypothetical protein
MLVMRKSNDWTEKKLRLVEGKGKRDQTYYRAQLRRPSLYFEAS